MGLDFNNNEIEPHKKRKVSYKKINNLHKFVAQQCMSNLVVGYFNGRIELGDRSLGNRSIIANPLNKDIKIKLINQLNIEKVASFTPSVKVDDLENILIQKVIRQIIIWRVFEVKKI